MIYLDNNATSLLDARVAVRMFEMAQQRFANPSSQHSAGRIARQVVEDAREKLVQSVGARVQGMSSDQLLFTSGGTEANNLALFGLLRSSSGTLCVSSIEHPSVLIAADYLRQRGRNVVFLRVNSDGVVCLDHLRAVLEGPESQPIDLVSMMAANNETGVLQPVREAAELCRRRGVLFHTDAVQVLGKHSLCFQDLNVDAMTITAHKIHGPIGVGALVIRHGVTLRPQLFGGFQQMALRPGTESPLLCDAFAFAAELVADVEARSSYMRSLRDNLEIGICEKIPQAVVIGQESTRLPHTLSISFPGVDRQALQLALDMRGIACSTGSACASGSSQPSHVLNAMGLAPEIVKGGVRFSVSCETTSEEIGRAVETIQMTVRSLLKHHSR
jgi:cysteine desulfurase